MKHSYIILVLAVLLASCASTGSGGAGLTIDEAIEQSAEKISAELPAGSRVAIVAFESPNDGLSIYIMEELTGSLIDHKIEVADRQNLDYLRQELDFQMSGEVSDESALSIGKFLGAQLVITGVLTHVGNTYRFRISAIRVETATRASVPRFDVRNDQKMRSMIATLAEQKTATSTAKYGVTGQTAPQTAGTFLDRGILFAMRKDYELAIADFTEAIRINPNLAGAYILRGRALVAIVAGLAGVDDNFGGIIHYRTFKFSEDSEKGGRNRIQTCELAIQDFTEAIRIDPNNSIAFNERGITLSILGEEDRAIEDFNQAIRHNPYNASAYSNRGYSYEWARKDYAKAISDFTQAIQIDPNNIHAYMRRAHTYYVDLKDIDRSIADYTQVIRIDPNYGKAYERRAGLYYQKSSSNNYDRSFSDLAIADYTQVIRIDPNNATVYSWRATIYGNFIYKDYDRAIADYTQAIRIRPDAYYYRGRGENYHDKKDYNRAIADYEAALRIGSNNATIQRQLDQARRGEERL